MTDAEKPIDPTPPEPASPAQESTEPSDVAPAPVRQKRDPSTLRVPKYEASVPPPPVDVARAHSVVGDGQLVFGDASENEPPLSLAEGVAGEAELCLGRADPRAARALADGPDVPVEVARSIRARAALMAGDVDAARAELGADRDQAAFAVADAALALAEGDTARAGRRIADALFERPSGLAERYLFALVKVAEGDMNEAVTALTDVARSAPAHAVARYQLGQILLATGDPARAGTLFEMAWQLQPSFVAPALALAEMLAESRQYGEALNLVSSVCDSAPDALAPRILQLRVLLEVGERDAALQLSSLLYGKVAQDPDVALLHAEALAEGEKPADAKLVLDELLQRKPEASIVQRARRQLARLALAERPPRSADAVALLKDAARAGGPLAGELCIELFHVAIAVGRRTDAEEALEILSQAADVGALISGAILARSHAMWSYAKKLGEQARTFVAGTPAEAQLEGFLATLP